jgi:hypothetical protein
MEGMMLAEIFMLRMEALARLSKDLVTASGRFVPLDADGPPKFKNAKGAPER